MISMKNNKIIASWNKIEPSDSANERMLSAILKQNRSIHDRKGKVISMSQTKKFNKMILVPITACLVALIALTGLVGNNKGWFNNGSSKTPITDNRGPSGNWGDSAPAIMVNGVIFIDTYEKYLGQVEEDDIFQVTSYYDDGMPAQNGQQNFDRTCKTQYVVESSENLIVHIDGEWRIFKASKANTPSNDVPTK